MKLTDKEILEMKELNQEQHIQLLQFMSLMQTCKTEAELEKLKEQYFNIPRYEFLQEYISEKNEKQSFSSYKTSLIYDMDKYQQDYKFVYGENFPAYKKESMPNNKVDYTVLNLLNEISECDDILAYQKLLNEKNKFPKVKIEAVSSDFTGIFFSNGLPVSMILNSPESNFNAQRQLVEAGYSPFTLPSVEDVKENGFDWLYEEISHFKEILNPNFIKMETQRNQESELNEYEEEFDDFVEQMDANGGMSSMVAEDDFNASFEEYEDVDEVQRQMDRDNGLIDENGNTHYQKIEEEKELEQWYETVDWEEPMESAEAWQNGTQEQIAYIRKRQKEKIIENKMNQESELNIDEDGNEIMFDNSKSETENRKSIKAIDVWNEIYENIAENPEYKAIKFATLDYLYNKGTDDAAGYENSFERNIYRLEEIGKSDKQLQQILEKYKDFKIDFDDKALTVKIAGTRNNNFNKAKQNLLDFVESKKYLRESEISQNFSDISQEEFEKYIHSEEFISKFGDWEKVNRLEKLKESEPLIGSDSIIVEGVDVSDIASRLRASYSIENLKQLQNIARDAGREVIAKLREEQNIKSPNPPVLINTDSGKEFKVQMTGINEIKNHNIFSKGHIEAISAIPELIKNAIYISSEPNEDGRKPQYTKFHYFAYGYNLDNEDYTAKIVFTETKDGELFYDQSLSAIEKGRLIDIIQKKNMLETFNQKNIQNSSEQDEVLNPLISQENLDNYDKRLVSICQVPQMLYLERNVVTRKWQPSKEAVEAVKNGTLYIEKQGQKYVMHESANNKIEKKDFSEIIDNNIENLQYVNESVDTEFSDNDIPVENNEIVQESESQYEMQNSKNNNTNISDPRPRNVQELHHFFINNPYVSGTPVPTLAMRNEQSGHSTFIEGYEFARFEDIGKPNPSFKDENGKQIKPDGQTVVLTKPGFKEEIDKETGEKKLVPDERKRKFIKISRELYEQAIKNSEIIAKRTPKNEQERQKMIDDYKEAANLDEKEQRANTASNFWHNYQAGVMTLANNKQEAMAFAKRLVNEMIPAEREKFATMVKKYEKLRGSDGKHLSYDQRIIDFYDNIGLKITSNSIWRDHVDDKYNTLDAIKKNTEVFDKEGQPLDKTCRMKIGDTIKMSVAVDSVLSNKKIKLPIQEYRLVAHSKDNNSVALISADGRQKIIKNREDFIKEVQKVEKKMMTKQQRQDKYESISM